MKVGDFCELLHKNFSVSRRRPLILFNSEISREGSFDLLNHFNNMLKLDWSKLFLLKHEVIFLINHNLISYDIFLEQKLNVFAEMPLLKAFSVEGAKEVADDVLAFVDVEMLVVVKEVGSIFGIYSGRVAEVEEEL
jgi:hypothetical protein